MAMKFVVCVNKEGLGDLSDEDVTIGHVYEAIGDPDQHGMIRAAKITCIRRTALRRLHFRTALSTGCTTHWQE
ncbi:hypothetical protein A4U49_04275 [Acidithiobacillus ferrivorans]|uniref:hypothetical protein n=1 Tax=Acidithiobacillus ferrivorans TaxID=160808 RepID=UPI000892E4DD|nr:hypothetical protein [Acidithiobacillus ferrivorans]OFA17004.1 hypothetical protein A4U49_04275 [Acidithiobacillus ferrivorans]